MERVAFPGTLDAIYVDDEDYGRAAAASLALTPDSVQLSGCSVEGRVPVVIEVGGRRRAAEVA